MDTPTPTDAHRKLHALAGTWIGEEKLFSSPWDPAGGTSLGRTVATPSLGGLYLVSDYEQIRGGRIVFRGHGVYGWDPEAERFTMSWFDSMDAAPGPPALGTWDGNRLTFQRATRRGHGRYVYTLLAADHYVFELEGSRDGIDWTPFLTGDYRRT